MTSRSSRTNGALALAAMLVASTGSSCGGGARLQEHCAPRAPAPSRVYKGTLLTKVGGAPVVEKATARFSGVTGEMAISFAPEGGSESDCLIGATGNQIKAGFCQDPGDPTGATVVAIASGSVVFDGVDRVRLDIEGHVLGIVGHGPNDGLSLEWSFSGEVAPPPPRGEDGAGPPRLKMHFGGHADNASFLDAPFPNATRVLGTSGGVQHVDVSDFPDAMAPPMLFPSIKDHLIFATLRDILSTLRGLAGDHGFSVTSGIFFQSTAPLAAVDSARIHTRLTEPYVLVPVLPPAGTGAWHLGPPHPLRAHFREQGGSLAVGNTLALLPVQGQPLLEDTLYLAFVRQGLSAQDGRGLVPAPEMALLAAALDGAPASDVPPEYLRALQALRDADGPAALGSVAALTVFRTGKPTDELVRFRQRAKAKMKFASHFAMRQERDAYCVYESSASVPVYQAGKPPYQLGEKVLPSVVGELAEVFTRTSQGGNLVFDPTPQAMSNSRVIVTVPKARAAPPSGWPMAVFVRAGAGLNANESPLVDRGPTLASGKERSAGCLTGDSERAQLATEACGGGPALEFARAGFVGVSVDGPQTGSRLVAGDPTFAKVVSNCDIPALSGEDQAMFNVCNPRAIADNIRESALETALVPDLLLDGPLVVEGADACHLQGARFDPKHIALMGHSMGATIAPLALALEPRFRAVVLSGANGSYIENLVAKERPAPALAPTLEKLLNLRSCTTEFDLLPTLFAWAEEPSDPAVYDRLVFGSNAAGSPPDVLMIQGIGDHYVPSPIANVSSLSMQLDLAGASYDGDDPRKCVGTDHGADVPVYTCDDGARRYPLSPVAALLPLVGRRQVAIPASGLGDNRRGATGAVAQFRRDRICRDDGHEVVYDIARARWQYRCFLQSFARGSARVFTPPPENPDDDTLEIDSPCPAP